MIEKGRVSHMPEKITLASPVSRTRSEWEIAYFTVDVEADFVARFTVFNCPGWHSVGLRAHE